MPVFFCRWPNGDFSVVEAVGEPDAIEALDEFANADGLELIEVEDFRLAMDFRLSGDGTFILDQIGERIHKTFWSMYPKLEAALEKGQAVIQRAVRQERRRVKEASAPAADTERGKEIQKTLDLPASLANEIVDQEAKKLLRRFKPRSKRQ